MPVLVALLISPLTWMWKAFVMVKLWSWFMVPAGIPHLGFVTAMGATLIFSMLSPTPKSDSEEVTVEWAVKAIGMGFLGPLLGLFFGWGLHLFTA